MSLIKNLIKDLSPELILKLIDILQVPVTANIQLHLAAFQQGKTKEQLFNVSVSEEVEDWFGITGTTIDADTAIVQFSPIYTENAINGHPALDFDSIDDFMILSAQPVSGTAARSIFIVARANNAISQNALLTLVTTPNTTGTLYNLTGEIGVRYNNATYIADSDSIVDATNASIVTATLPANANVDDTVLYKNGALIIDFAPSTAAVNTNTGSAVIGVSQTLLTEFLDGVIGEIIVYDRLLSDNERNAVLNYLSLKWGIGLSSTPSFVSIWKTDNTGTSNDDQITLPLEASGTYNFLVRWGDGTFDIITAFDDAAVTHTYASAGTFTVTIFDTIDGWRFNNGGDVKKILSISSLGQLLLGNNDGYFNGASNLTITATDILDITATTNWSSGFGGCSLLTNIPSINSWNFTFVTTTTFMFFNSGFNGFMGDIDVTSLLTAGSMYRNSPFNKDISNWKPTSLTDAANFLRGGSFSTENYDKLLIAWEQLALQNNVTIHFGSTQFGADTDAITAKASIESNFNWEFNDGGQVP